MTHLVLARKYRPKNFRDVVGQDPIVDTLKAAIEKDRVAHAMLFTGGRGIGKTTIARLVAKALVCLERDKAEPCGSCAECLAIDNFSSLDVIEIDGASHTGVDDIRELRDSARYQPTSAKVKVFIIDEVHMLSTNAFNALLKILEEPPAHIRFIFATTEQHKIPKTVLSRCQRYDFRRFGEQDIFNALKSIVKNEGYEIEDQGLHLIASRADGALRDALSFTEQILSSGQSSYSAHYIAEMLGVVSYQAVKTICLDIVNGDVAPALLSIKEIYEKGLDLCELMDAIAERFRILSLAAHVEEVKNLISTIDEDDIKLAKNYDKADIKRLFAMSIDGMTQVFQAQKPLFALELFVMRAALRPPISEAVAISHCLQKLDALMHNRPVPDKVVSQTPPPLKVALPITRSNVSDSENLSTATVKVSLQDFSKFISELAKIAPGIASHLRHARPLFSENPQALTLAFEQALHYEQIMANKDDHRLKQTLKSIFGQELVLRIELKKASPSKNADESATVAELDEEKHKQKQAALYEKAQNHELVKKALSIFGGDIVEIKRPS